MRRVRPVLVFGLCLGLLGGVPVWAQQPQAPAGQEAQAKAAPTEGEGEQAKIDVSQIDRILRGEERVMQGEIFFYDPAGRRDPFRSLLDGVQEEEGAARRPPGLPGTLIEELKLEGVVVTPEGIIAFALNSRDNLSYILKPGTKLYNGEVEKVLPEKVVYKQQVNDPKALKPYTEVVREIGQK